MSNPVSASFDVPADTQADPQPAAAPASTGSSGEPAIGERLVPDFKVKLNGSPLKPELDYCLKWVEVQQSIEAIDMVVMNFDNPAGYTGDSDDFKYGTEVEIEVGYVGEVYFAFKGDIVSLEPDFPTAGQPSVLVRAYDRLHRYRRGKKQRTFLNQKVSDVVSSLSSEEGLSPQVEDTGTQHEYLLQNNQTNIDFIHELARRHGYEAEVVEGSKLHFKKPRTTEGKAHTLSWGKDLKSFYPRKSVSNVPTEVTTHYWDMKKKEAVTQKHGALHGSLEPKDQAPQEAEKAFGKAELHLTLRPNTAPKEAEALAWAVYNEAALNSVRGRGTCVGEPAVKPGIVLELLGLGSTWSGLYYVTGATHLLHRSSGYSTQFEVRRNGTGYSNENVVIEDPAPPPSSEDDSSSMNASVTRGGG